VANDLFTRVISLKSLCTDPGPDSRAQPGLVITTSLG
jgi:hypothetical protein